MNIIPPTKEFVPDGYKKCTKCEELLPATTEYFAVQEKGRYGVTSMCKKCHKNYYYEHRNLKRPVFPEGYRQCFACKQMLPATTEYFYVQSKKKDGLNPVCKPCCSIRYSQQRQENIEARRAYDRSVYERRKEHYREYARQYHKRFREAHPLQPRIIDGKKQCSQCKEWKPATQEFFHVRGNRLRSACKVCRNATNAFYNAAHKDVRQMYYQNTAERRREYWQTDSYRQYRLAYYAKNRERILKQDKVRRDAHPERIRERTKRNHDRHMEYQRQYREANREKCNAYVREYIRAHPEQYRTYRLNRIARVRGAEGKYTVDDIRKQYERQKGTCYWCHKKLTRYHVDHIVPLARGGTNWPDNLVIACPRCNCSRGKKLPHEWFQGGRLM